MSALRRIGKVVGGYKVIVKCTNKPMEEQVFGSYQECEKFADNYFLDYFGVALNSIHHPEGDGVEPDGVNPESLETIEIEIPMNERLKELAEQAGGVWSEDWGCFMSGTLNLTRFAELVRQDEREACAKLCDDEARQSGSDHEAGGMYWCAEAIRERGEK